jgi:cysteine-rich repeat protein
MDKLYAYALGATLLGVATLAVVQCSDSAVCGNGVKEGSEQCDNGAMNGTPGNGCSSQCKLVSIPRAMVNVSYYRLKDESPNFTGSTAMDLGIDHAHVVLDGPTPADETWSSNMNSNQYVVSPGSYQATITLFDAAGNALTNPVKTMMQSVDVPNMIFLSVDFHMADFLKQDYMGTLYIDPNWGQSGTGCNDASPAVQMESVTLLKMNGAPVAGMTLDGKASTPLHALDGTPGACFSRSSDDLFEKVPNLPWGHYQLTIVGKVAGGTIGYCFKTDDIFVGPGADAPTYEILVPAAGSDAGACP